MLLSVALLSPSDVLGQQVDQVSGGSGEVIDDAYCKERRQRFIDAAIAFAAAGEIVPLDQFGSELEEGESRDINSSISSPVDDGFSAACLGDMLSREMYLLQRFCNYQDGDFAEAFLEAGYLPAHAAIWIDEFNRFGNVGTRWW